MNTIEQDRIVVTGVGIVSPLGITTEQTWQNLLAGKTGVTLLDDNIRTETGLYVAGQIRDFDASAALPYVDRKMLSRTNRAGRFGLSAIHQALGMADLLDEDQIKTGIPRESIGVRMGSCVGSMDQADAETDRRNGKKIKPTHAFLSEPERISSVPTMIYGIEGSQGTMTAACATGNHSIIDGIKDLLTDEHLDIIIAGGTESTIHPLSLDFYNSMGALSTSKDPSEASRPFDKKRDGFVMAEGAGVLILERESHARKRGVKPLAEIVGWGSASDGSIKGSTEPTGKGATRAMNYAMYNMDHDNGVIYVNAHGTSTPLGDRVEAGVIQSVFKDSPVEVYTSSTKGGTGHLMGASGAVEAVICVLAIHDQIIPANTNLKDQDDDNYLLIPHDPVTKQIAVAYNNSFGFGGVCSVTAYRPYLY